MIFVTTFTVTCDDPLRAVEISLPMPPLVHDHDGAFVLELLHDNVQLGSHRIQAKKW